MSLFILKLEIKEKKKDLYKIIGLDERTGQPICASLPGPVWVRTDSADTETGEGARNVVKLKSWEEEKVRSRTQLQHTASEKK